MYSIVILRFKDFCIISHTCVYTLYQGIGIEILELE